MTTKHTTELGTSNGIKERTSQGRLPKGHIDKLHLCSACRETLLQLEKKTTFFSNMHAEVAWGRGTEGLQLSRGSESKVRDKFSKENKRENDKANAAKIFKIFGEPG